jgi:hypothetical protein
MYYASDDGREAMDRLEDQGFSFPTEPKDQPELPHDLSDLADADLMEEFSIFTAWADYAGAQSGLAVIAEREAERLLESEEARVWRDQMRFNPKAPVAAVKAVMGEDAKVSEARSLLNKAYAYRRLVQDLAERYERDAMVLSRELTRRTQSEWNAKQARRERWKP